jgi:hypothetical protein
VAGAQIRASGVGFGLRIAPEVPEEDNSGTGNHAKDEYGENDGPTHERFLVQEVS